MLQHEYRAAVFYISVVLILFENKLSLLSQIALRLRSLKGLVRVSLPRYVWQVKQTSVNPVRPGEHAGLPEIKLENSKQFSSSQHLEH